MFKFVQKGTVGFSQSNFVRAVNCNRSSVGNKRLALTGSFDRGGISRIPKTDSEATPKQLVFLGNPQGRAISKIEDFDATARFRRFSQNFGNTLCNTQSQEKVLTVKTFSSSVRILGDFCRILTIIFNAFGRKIRQKYDD